MKTLFSTLLFSLTFLLAGCQKIGTKITIGSGSVGVISSTIDSASLKTINDSITSIGTLVRGMKSDSTRSINALKDSLLNIRNQILSTLAEVRITNANIVVDGNSLTSTTIQFGGTPFPTQMRSLEPFKSNNSTIRSFGVGGQNIDAMTADAAAEIDTALSTNKKNILVVWEITNQMAASKNPRTVINKLWTYCDARKAAGWIVIVLTSLPRNSDLGVNYNLATYNADLLTANNYVIAEYATHSAAYIDVRIESCLSNYSNSCFANDGVHLSNSGYLAVANLVKNKIIEISKN